MSLSARMCIKEKDMTQKQELLRELNKPVLTEAQVATLMQKKSTRSWFANAALSLIRWIFILAMALVLFMTLVFAGHYSGFEGMMRSLLGVENG